MTRLTEDGTEITFDSKREAVRYDRLKVLQRDGMIRDLQLQPEYELQPHFRGEDGKMERAIKYVGDFEYEERQEDGTWKLVTEDVKGMRTEAYKIKAKMFHYHTGRRIRET